MMVGGKVHSRKSWLIIEEWSLSSSWIFSQQAGSEGVTGGPEESQVVAIHQQPPCTATFSQVLQK